MIIEREARYKSFKFWLIILWVDSRIDMSSLLLHLKVNGIKELNCFWEKPTTISLLLVCLLDSRGYGYHANLPNRSKQKRGGKQTTDSLGGYFQKQHPLFHSKGN